MSDIVRINDPEIDVQQIMREIRETIAEKRRDPAYVERMRRLEKNMNEQERPVGADERFLLIERMTLPPSHRKGFVGKCANMVLGKLFLAIKSMLSAVFLAQEQANRSFQKSMKHLETELETLNEQFSSFKKNMHPSETEFDYLAFENAFRGSEKTIRERQRIYLPYLTSAKTVVDIGCGRGEFVALLTEQGKHVTGVDINPRMIAHCRAQGLSVVEEDAVSYLKRAKSGSVDAIFASHIVEHISFAELVQLLTAAYQALVTGGVMICESPNPLTLGIFARAFYVDPTHLRPVHPEGLRFIMERTGFTHTELLLNSPFPADEQLETTTLEGVAKQNAIKLNELLYGNQDFAVIARK